jgi:diguanylate cyclase (GGDEF)-like protein/PAS domain S-box-containing protein
MQALAESEAHYRTLAENAAELVVQSRNGVIEWVSPSVMVALGGEDEDWMGLDLTDVLHPDDLFLFDPTTAQIDAGRTVVARARVRGMDGAYHWVEARSRPVMDDDGVVSSHITSVRIIDDLVIAEDSLKHQATHDSLTGLLNRGEIVSRLVGMSRHLPRTGEHTALLYCDLDNLKSVNDMYGHQAGDEVLRTLGERLRALVRADDLVARIGGDELLVVLTGVHSLEEATALAEKIRESAAQDIGVGSARVRCTLSIGATLARTTETVDDVIARADEALYSAKDAGRNRVVAVP